MLGPPDFEGGLVPEQRVYRKDGLEFARAVTFFDAIFAFAVTLLITTVDNFDPDAWSSPSAMWSANGSSLTAFAISFVVVVSFWRASHGALAGLAALNPRIITLNCLVMFGVVLIPFATEALGKLDLPLPVAVYAAVIAGTSLAHRYMEDQAYQAGLGTQMPTATRRRWTWIQGAMLPAVFLGSIPIAYLIAPNVAELSWLSLLVLMPVVERIRRRSDPEPEAAERHP
ncbi:MAG TPA: TMEM175 family protein [Nakamurella sp.]